MKTKYDWSGVESRIKFIAMDCDGQIYGFTHKPYYNPFGFGMTDGFSKRLYVKNSVLSWQDSLEERPND